ncbi:MAG: thioredoxin domain-containing protein [Parafilimonas sp.]
MKEHKYTNKLINETSPYLLQHAHNPVNWFAWSDEALQKSREEDKPILISIGYSACHWCHVMEHESFEDEATAQLMNQHFINIKIDREERPDIDHIYMDAVQTITGSGGWPLNVFLTPELKPFYGGTYYPPVRAFNRSSWKEVLTAVANAYKEKRNEITEQAENLTQHLLNTNNLNAENDISLLKHETLDAIAQNLVNASDKEWGGFGQAPKFPQTFSILYLLRHYHFTGNENSLNAAILSLDKMMMGGIYDHLGGGFCRYSTDKRWQIPHFEKMLYDNALLVDAYTEAYQLTKKEKYKIVVEESIEFIKNEMTSPEGGFYSALDADSEGIEGKFYTWSKKEIDELLKEKSEVFCITYNISDIGNWEHTNILWQPEALETITDRSNINKQELIKQLDISKKILLKAREKRVRPGLDNKLLLSWNALMIISLCKAYSAFGKNEYLELAKTNISFIEKYLFESNVGSLFHSWNKTLNLQPAFLDDYATLIQAYIFLHQSTADWSYLRKAKFLTNSVIELFSDEKNCLFYFTSKNQKDVLIRKIEIYDGATPSGNSLMAANLIVLSVFFDLPEWKQRAISMLSSLNKFLEKYPTSFGVWELNLQLLIYGLKEIVLMGDDYKDVLKKVLQEYIPLKVLQASSLENKEWPLIKERMIIPNQTIIYICENYSCLKPAESFEKFKKQLTKHF